MKSRRLFLLVLAATAALRAELHRDEKFVANEITAGELRAHVSFLASDALEGRDTPSRGLDVAAEYIASEFRRVGLEPLGDDGYFQTTTYKDAKVRNVAALLRGSDPVLKDTYVLLTAHYDHIGIARKGAGDLINNGANDDASGVSTVLALAEDFARAPHRPRRSIVFVTFYGEEKGLIGARYYVSHPLVPLARTVVDVNFEHMGRTDDNDGPQLKTLTITGFDFSDFAAWMTAAGRDTGVAVVKLDKYSDRFFNASDNAALARAGVPAHTVCTSFLFPDYHAAGDEWQKIDYDNMAVVGRALAVAVWRLADTPQAVHWNAGNQQTERYIKAAVALQAAAP